MKKLLLLSVLGMLAVGGIQAQNQNDHWKTRGATMPAGQPIVSSHLRSASVPVWSWDDAATEYAGGSGTEDDPYLVADPYHLLKICKDSYLPTEEDLMWTSVQVGVYFKQVADIDLSAASCDSVFIGMNAFFCGNYDGNGYKITGYNFSSEGEDFPTSMTCMQALFLNAADGTLKNIVMEDAKLVVKDAKVSNALFLFSFLAGNTDNEKIENCRVSGDIEFSTTGPNTYLQVGGISANILNSEINNCVAEGSIKLNASVDADVAGAANRISAAGIVSDAEGVSKISNCINRMNVSSEASGTSEQGLVVRAAGIVGWAHDLTLENSANMGDMEAKASNTLAEKSWAQAGGLIACVDSVAAIRNCWNASRVSSAGHLADQPAAPLVCYPEAGTTYDHVYFDKLLFTEPVEGGSALETGEMQSLNFVETLNANLPEGALEWGYVEGAYPVLGEAQEEPEDPTANESVTASEAVLRVLPGAVVVTSPEAVEFAAYTFSGAMQANELLPAGTSTVNLPAGLYILKVGDETYKVNVK